MNRYYNDSGSLFRNDRRKGDKDPEFRGQATINGKAYWVAAWKNEGKNGKAYLRLRFTEQQARAPGPPQTGRPAGTRSAYPVSPPHQERIPGADDDEGADQGWEEILR